MRSLALRGTAITLGSTAFQQIMRLVSNLILTRLLFPEAFGLIALVGSFTTGLQMFSDMGLRPSIIQNKRGEDPDFLNTAWTIQIIRGVILWLGSCALAWPVAQFYGEDQILWLLPLVGLNALIGGFASTKPIVASRNLRLGRQTVIGMAIQVISLSCMIGFALIWPSVWALAVSGLVSSTISVWTSHRLMPGVSNRLRWNREAAHDLLNFGRFIFLSTMATFLAAQGDKLFLGRMVSLADLGIYNIAFFLAAFPGMLGGRIADRILFPLYRQKMPTQGPDRLAKIRRARDLVIGGQMILCSIMAFLGIWLVDLMYDNRYAAAGPMLVILALCLLPKAVMVGGSSVLLAEGDSRRFSRLVMAQTVLDIASLIAGFWLFGIFGVLLSRGVAFLGTYPLQQLFVARYNAMHLGRDMMFLLASVIVAVAVIWLNWDALSEFYRVSRALAPAVTGSWQPTTVFAR
ncbi:polysaccharide biosynthesis protein [Paracoccus subflavus]|uniref:Polysaccharide biosynthesis protein n=1 Tax=Paracoccus subflavus TaxID=2528244 RepID=A0A4Q9G481_9RHOB|nr:oligosaccharide flippase family protein [Paracoccus subflavus]TBN38662.1 polysaccharide biosynthesis protein [Paracoccus subflavus]